MPEVEEVFRLATNKVKPDPNALERQARRQRASARKNRTWAYVAVAAVVALAAVAAVVFAGTRDDVTPGDPRVGEPSSSPGSLTFVSSISPVATTQRPTILTLSGSATATVPNLPLDAFAPSLSSDGSTIAFVAAPQELGYNQVGIMGIDGSNAHAVATPGIDVGTVAISPDGSHIAFEGTVNSNTDIYVMATDGTELLQLTDDPATDQYPAWSPDGTTIVYDNAGSREQSEDPQFSDSAEIYTVPTVGGTPTRITHYGGYDAAPAYSPDGMSLVDQSSQGLSIMDADGGNRRAFVSIGGFTPRWSPNGKTIAFTYFRGTAIRPTVQFGADLGERPVVILALADATTGEVTRLIHVGSASDLNTPQWVDGTHVLVMRVPAHFQ